MQKLKLLFDTSRPVSWINTAYPFAVGYLMVGGELDARFLVGTIFFLIPYNLLMYGINDVFDYESDIRNPRKGGVEGAITAQKYHPLIIYSSVALSLPFVIALVFLGSIVSTITLAVVLFFVIAYSAKGLRFKEIPFLDSATSSIHFVGPLVFAYALLGESSPVAWLIAIAFFAWGVAAQAFGAVQDIVPDRQAQIRSIATVLGAQRTVWFSASMYAISIVLVLLLGAQALLVALSGLLYLWNVLEFASITDKTSFRARRGWKRFMWINMIVGFVITISCILTTLR